MSFLSENKFFVGAVGIALSSAAVGYALARYRQQKPEKKYEYKVGGIVVPKAAADYFMEYGIREPLPLQKLREATYNHPKGFMIGGVDGSQLMRLLMQLVNARKVIEIGVFTGYNTLSMALTVPPDGRVVACDVTDEYMKYVNSQQYFKEAGVESKIDLRLQSAITTLDELIAAGESGSYDLVFIDADKTGYDQYYEKSLQLLRSGGVIVIDNALRRLGVCDPEIVASDEGTRAVHSLNVKVHKDGRVEMCLISVADGLNIVMKL